MKNNILEKQNKELKKKIYLLYSLLDDIDTTSDIYKNNIEARCKHIDEIHRKRFDIVDRNMSDELYDEFYRQEDDILTPIFKEEKE